MEIIRKWMDADSSIRMKYSDAFFNLSNQAELQEGEADCVHRFGVIERRRTWEEGLGAASPQNRELLDNLNASYRAAAPFEYLKVFYRELLVRSMRLGQCLMRMGGAGRDGVEHQRELFRQGLDQTDARVEKELLAFSVKEFLSNMPEPYLAPIHRELLQQFGTRYDEMARWLWDHSLVAQWGQKSNEEVVAAFTGNLEKDVLYRYLRELSIVTLNNDQDAQAPNLRSQRHQYLLARYHYLEKLGVPQYPDANSTMRLTYGQIQPLKPWDGVYTHWQSTA